MGLFHRLLLIGNRPQNPLEEALSDFLKGRTPIEPFLQTLIQSRIFLLVRAGEPEAPIVPLTLQGAAGPAVCIFTSPERAAPMQKTLERQKMDFTRGIELEFSAFNATLSPDLGMLVNAGTLFSTEALPAGLAGLRQASDQPLY